MIEIIEVTSTVQIFPMVGLKLLQKTKGDKGTQQGNWLIFTFYSVARSGVNRSGDSMRMVARRELGAGNR